MRILVRGVVLAGCAVLALGSAGQAVADEPPGAETTWSPSLATGEPAGVSVTAGGVTLDPETAFLLPREDPAAESAAELVPTGLLTLPARQLGHPTGSVATSVDADLPAGASATVDVRGRRLTGGWTEWIPAPPNGTADLPEPTDEVQGRLVLTGPATSEPLVRRVTLTALRGGGAEGAAEATIEAAPLRYSVFATREGLVGGITANGHRITERDTFVALPSRRALSARGTSDYSVKVCASNGRCAFAPVWDVGPWNIQDDYWNPSAVRQQWQDLPQGVPEAQAAYRDGYNGGKDGFGRKVANPAGIDLADGVFWDALGLRDNATVTVEYLWTGAVRLAAVAVPAGSAGGGTEGARGVVEIRRAPAADAAVVGFAVDRAEVPVECVTPASGAGTQVAGAWLRVGKNQFIAAAAVPAAGSLPACSVPDQALSPRREGPPERLG